MAGNFYDPLYEYVSIKIGPCTKKLSSSSNMNYINRNCLMEYSPAALAQAKSKIGCKIIFMNSVMDYNKYGNPISYFIEKVSEYEINYNIPIQYFSDIYIS